MKELGTFTPTQPDTRWLDDDRRMVLLGKFQYTSLGGVTYTAPKGMITDGKSVPRIFWGLHIAGSPFTGPARRPAIIHDRLCQEANEEDVPRTRNGLKKYADILFKEMIRQAMKEYFARYKGKRWPRLKRFVKSGAMKLGVRVGHIWTGAFDRIFGRK